jgi:hypothetical protein
LARLEARYGVGVPADPWSMTCVQRLLAVLEVLKRSAALPDGAAAVGHLERAQSLVRTSRLPDLEARCRALFGEAHCPHPGGRPETGEVVRRLLAGLGRLLPELPATSASANGT